MNPKSFTITLTEAELEALSGLLDAGVRQVGLRGVQGATALLAAIERAVKDANEATSNVVPMEAAE